MKTVFVSGAADALDIEPGDRRFRLPTQQGETMQEPNEQVAAEAPARDFHIGTVLSIIGEKLLSPSGTEGLYLILTHIVGEPLQVAQLIVARNLARPWILEQHPQLESVDESQAGPDTWRAWLEERVAEFGETLSIKPLPAGKWAQADPLRAMNRAARRRIIRATPKDIRHIKGLTLK